MNQSKLFATALRDTPEFQALRNHLEALDAALDVGLLIIESNGVVAYASLRALAIAGAGDLPELRERIGRIDVTPAHASGSSRLHPTRGTVRIDTGKGSAVTVQLELHEIGEGDSRQFLGVLRDPAMIHATELDSRHAAHLRGLSHLTAAAAHDARGPLNSIALNLELLRNALDASGPEANDRRLRITGILDSEVRRLDVMLRTLLNQTLLQDDSRDRFDLAELVRDLHAILVPYCRAHRIQLDLITPEAPILVDGNRDAIKHAMMNVIINGLEAMPTGGTLGLSLGCVGEKAVFSVTDTGRGITPELSNRLFIRFTTTKKSGAGSGLYVARRVIDGHGGAIRVKSEVGLGSCFEIELPSAAD